MSGHDDSPAFPQHQFEPGTGRQRAVEVVGGMTLRDYFAAKAMPPFLMVKVSGCSAQQAAEIAASSAYQMADAMLKARQA